MANYHFRESGLDYVWLENGVTHWDTPYGPATSIKAIDDLLTKLALYVSRKPWRLTGQEFRYLRSELGMPPEDAAQAHGISEHRLRLWERGRREIPKPHDMLQRLLHLKEVAGHISLRTSFDLVSVDLPAIQQRLFASIDETGWNLRIVGNDEVEALERAGGEAAVETWP